MERKIVFDHRKINYKGIFSFTELYNMIDSWFAERGYTKHELRYDEEVKEDGKRIYVNKEPSKNIKDYMSYVIQCEIECNHLKEVEVERDGKKMMLNQGDCTVVITGHINTDYEAKWEKKPWYYFIRGLVDKFVWNVHLGRGEGELAEECGDFLSQVRSFLNLYRYK
ncbi:MAG: hypothetical protein ACQEP1_06035 [Nanobdellota archaeon]